MCIHFVHLNTALLILTVFGVLGIYNFYPNMTNSSFESEKYSLFTPKGAFTKRVHSFEYFQLVMCLLLSVDELIPPALGFLGG